MPKFHVQRSIEINAARDEVFRRVADFSTWRIWSPWLIAEPDAKVTVSDDSSSVGSTYAWDGEVVGAGEMIHKALENGTRIDAEIAFVRPWKSKADVSFELADGENDGTKITWNMHGGLPFFMFWYVGQMKAMIGMDYERGLKMLKEWIETGNIESKVEIKGIESMEPTRIVGARRTCVLNEIAGAMDDALNQAKQEMDTAGFPTDQGCAAVYHSFNMKSQVMEFSAGYIVPESAPAAPESLTDWSIPTTDVFSVRHTGPYCHLGNGWSAANQHVFNKKMRQSKVGTFEIYRNMPGDVPDSELVTDIYLPLK